jgi:hypothetical protein
VTFCCIPDFLTINLFVELLEVIPHIRGGFPTSLVTCVRAASYNSWACTRCWRERRTATDAILNGGRMIRSRICGRQGGRGPCTELGKWSRGATSISLRHCRRRGSLRARCAQGRAACVTWRVAEQGGGAQIPDRLGTGRRRVAQIPGGWRNREEAGGGTGSRERGSRE